MDQIDLREAMDACRPRSDDLRLPDLAPLAERLASDSASRRLFDRLQRLDRRISTTALDVSVPAGLAERILARVQIASGNSTAVASNELSTTPVSGPGCRAESPPHGSARLDAGGRRGERCYRRLLRAVAAAY
jgi:hypothetical protein